MNTEQVRVTWFKTVKSRLNAWKWMVSARSGLLLARVSVISEGLLDGRRTDGTLTGESKRVAKTDWEVDEGLWKTAGTCRAINLVLRLKNAQNTMNSECFLLLSPF